MGSIDFELRSASLSSEEHHLMEKFIFVGRIITLLSLNVKKFSLGCPMPIANVRRINLVKSGNTILMLRDTFFVKSNIISTNWIEIFNSEWFSQFNAAKIIEFQFSIQLIAHPCFKNRHHSQHEEAFIYYKASFCFRDPEGLLGECCWN